MGQQTPHFKASGRPRVLLIAEAVTLAHVGRPIALAHTLDQARYEIEFATDPRYRRFLGETPWTFHPLTSLDSSIFLDRLARGRPVYDAATLHDDVKADLALLEQSTPDLIIGDFRLSLSVSARLAGIPYAAITNAYWSPCVQSNYHAPEHPLLSRLPVVLADSLFRLVRPFAFALHTLPLNQVRRAYGLPSLGLDLRTIYTAADFVLYADAPELFTARQLPSSHHYLGPVLWSPPQSKPEWWDRMPTDRPIIYLTLGSSGPVRLLSPILRVLGDLPVYVMLATADRIHPAELPDNVYAAPYLPGDEAAARAALVICNGGSPTSQQALNQGTPVLGIASNLDQILNMAAVATAGAGVLMRADRLKPEPLRATVMQMLTNPSFRTAAGKVSEYFKIHSAAERFPAFVQSRLPVAATPMNHKVF